MTFRLWRCLVILFCLSILFNLSRSSIILTLTRLSVLGIPRTDQMLLHNYFDTTRAVEYLISKIRFGIKKLSNMSWICLFEMWFCQILYLYAIDTGISFDFFHFFKVSDSVENFENFV